MSFALPAGLNAEGFAHLVQEWARCEEYIERAIKLSEGGFGLDHVWSEIMNRRAQFWPAAKSAVVTRIENHPSGLRSCLFWLAGGDDLAELVRMENSLSEWAIGMGCNRVEIVGRRGWLRALDGYREGSTILVRDL